MKMSEYERVKKQCIKTGVLWEDPDFSATQSSVFYHQIPPFEFQWRRPKEFVETPRFMNRKHHQFDVVPGKLGDKWFVSCLGVLCLSRGLLYRVVPPEQSFSDKDGYAGVFRFRLWWCGEWVEVLVDDRLPHVNGKLVFVQPQHSTDFWASLLEKAYAKLHGSYEALKYGSTLDGLADMTGGAVEFIGMKHESNSFSMVLHRHLEMTSVVTCKVQNESNWQNADKLANGILINVPYRILSIDKIETYNGETVKLIKMKGMMGPTCEHMGSWSRDAVEWDKVPPAEKGRLRLDQLAEGEFWMLYSEFLKTFTCLEITHLDEDLSKDIPSLRKKVPWSLKEYSGTWQKGVTAGGCRNHADTFHLNPHLQLLVPESDDVLVCLNQHNIIDLKMIGFTLYKLPKTDCDTISRTFFKKNRSLVNSKYTNSRQVSQRCYLEKGNYLIVPTTFEVGEESSFDLRVYSSRPLKLRILDAHSTMLQSAFVKPPEDEEPKGVAQYEAVFLQLADEHKTVNCFELQELLEACLPNDYIKSCATVAVCKQAVLVFDRVSRGRLKYSDFKHFLCSLKYWQATFKNHTKEKMGILRVERFKDALLEVGFQLSTDVLSVLTLKFIRKDGTLRFGDFVSAILHLYLAFDIFDKKDPLQKGAAKFTMAEWLESALSC